MAYYHCSPTGGIETLLPRMSKRFGGDKVVYMTSLIPMALMYGISHFEYTYGYHWKDGKPGGIFYWEEAALQAQLRKSQF